MRRDRCTLAHTPNNETLSTDAEETGMWKTVENEKKAFCRSCVLYHGKPPMRESVSLPLKPARRKTDTHTTVEAARVYECRSLGHKEADTENTERACADESPQRPMPSHNATPLHSRAPRQQLKLFLAILSFSFVSAVCSCFIEAPQNLPPYHSHAYHRRSRKPPTVNVL